ncbi:NmrA family NAD(P)-binding protein [Bradyrhizobium australafricanum]|uniref:NmrA family NAD(P)-binding protein n=1 Tax=Bradyrhizobium australafricanum TaxID=2821406 RepID=UPI001CE285A5|nr:NmrA family NAD(P)-binding protein [Bradyrhizobium australafricanum]MCA6100539.1 NmrA family NAD(P)-binding protein [Bradyrhizobium australafricanum]
MKQRILVTGATGETGRYTSEALIKSGFPVRALVHKVDERSEKLRATGAEVIVGDLLDFNAVREALKGVKRAYFVFPIRPGLIDATAYFAQASKEAELDGIVNMSQISARENSKSQAARDHWIAERVFDWSGIPVSHIRPTFFAQWLTYPHNRKHILERGVISQPLGNGRHAPIAAEDQARFISAILADPKPHMGKTYPLFGPVEMDQAGIAAAVSEVIGRPVTYDPISIDTYRQRLEAMGMMPAFLIQHLCAVAQDYQDGIFAGSDEAIGQVTGKPPMTVQQFVTSHISLFNHKPG